MNQPDARQIEKRILPPSDWGHAPEDVRALAAEDPSRALAYDLTFGWCVLQRSGGEPQVVYCQKSPKSE
jgi:hypothetical protein